MSNPGHLVVNLQTGTVTLVQWTDAEWQEIRDNAIRMDVEKAAQPIVKTIEQRLAALEAKA